MMVTALLAFLVPAAPADVAGDLPVRQLEASNPVKDGDASGNPAFAQMLAEYQQRLQAPNLAAKPMSAPVVAASSVDRAPVSVRDIRLLAAKMADAKLAPQAVAAAMEGTDKQVTPLPPIDPTSALSLIPSPIAYTTDTEVAAVVVEKNLGADNPVIPEAKEAFALLSDLTPAADGQRLSFAPPPSLPQEVTHAQMQEETIAPSEQQSPELSGPEVNLPEFIPVERSDISSAPQAIDTAKVTPAAQEVIAPPPAKPFGMKDVALEAVTPEEVEIQEKEDSRPREEADAQVDADNASGAPAAAMGGPLVLMEEGGDAPESEPQPLISAGGHKLPAKPPAAAQSETNSDASSDQGLKGNGAKPQAHPVPQGEAKPVGPEASVKPDARGKTDDFSALMSDKLAVQTTAAIPHAQHAQAPDAGKDVPLVKIAHAQPGAPLEEQVSVHIRQAVNEGVDQVTIKLNPPELGKLHIKMEIGHDGRAQVLVTADNKDTFEMLQRDARGLQQALSDAGVKTDSGSLQFDLRGQNGQQASTGQFDFSNQQDQQNASTDSGGSEKIVASAAGEGDVALSLHQGEVNYTVNVSEGVDIKV